MTIGPHDPRSTQAFTPGDHYPLRIRDEVFQTTIGQVVRREERVWLELQFTPGEHARFHAWQHSVTPDMETRGSRIDWASWMLFRFRLKLSDAVRFFRHGEPSA
jgi:hypothetical protein